MIYKVGILGATGRMGLETAALLREGHFVGGDMLELGEAVAGSKKIVSVEGVPVRTLDDSAWETVHVWVDFSRPAATMKLLKEIDRPIVIATTGFSDEERGKIAAYAEKHPVLLAANTSPGMSAVLAALKTLGLSPELGFKAVVEEAHHERKKDSPSGTAKAILGIIGGLGFDDPQVNVIRAGGIPGDHAVRFISEDEEVAVSHRVWDRKVFAKGALRAARWLAKRTEPGLYGMEDIDGE